jgi:hypothetical protein
MVSPVYRETRHDTPLRLVDGMRVWDVPTSDFAVAAVVAALALNLCPLLVNTRLSPFTCSFTMASMDNVTSPHQQAFDLAGSANLVPRMWTQIAAAGS